MSGGVASTYSKCARLSSVLSSIFINPPVDTLEDQGIFGVDTWN